MTGSKTCFAPQLYIPNGVTTVDFYEAAFGAIELRRFSNDDGTIHVSELEIDGAVFHLHEVTAGAGHFSPDRHGGVTTVIGLFVENVDETIARAVSAGAELLSPAQDYDYGYRQGDLCDPFGHRWMIESKI